jgi:hypothetical protein
MRTNLNTTMGLMGIVACVSVVIYAYIAVESDTGSVTAGATIVLACIGAVAVRLTEESNARSLAYGRNVSVAGMSTAFLKPCSLAILIVGLADGAFICTYAFVVGGPPFFLFSADVRARTILPEGMLAGTVVALVVCYLARRGFSGSTPGRTRLICRLCLLAIVAVLMALPAMWQRAQYRWEQARWHDAWAHTYEQESTSFFSTAREARARANRAEYHSQMREKWEHGASRPWLSLAPDPPPPDPGLVK